MKKPKAKQMEALRDQIWEWQAKQEQARKAGWTGQAYLLLALSYEQARFVADAITESLGYS